MKTIIKSCFFAMYIDIILKRYIISTANIFSESSKARKGWGFMVELKNIPRDEKVYGTVIEVMDNSFVMNRYGENNYGRYEKLETVEKLSDEEAVDVLAQKTVEARKRRLHNYFRSAKYISEEVIDMLKRADNI